MSPLGPQLAPTTVGTSASATGGPPAAGTLSTFPPATNPIHFPSFEKKGWAAPAVPGSGFAASPPRDRTTSDCAPGEPATYTISCPSGEIAISGPEPLSA